MTMGEEVLAIIQARMASSRLPGKVLAPIEGTAMLGHVVRRTRLATSVRRVIVATSTDAEDSAILDYCVDQDIACFRGSHFDVLDRYYWAARHFGADAVVRITADCPLMDAAIIDSTVALVTSASHGDVDFAATRLPPPWKRTFPIGLDVEVSTMTALERAWTEARAADEREHVMPFIYKGVRLERPRRGISLGTSTCGLRIAILQCDEDLGSQRWTVDTPEDLEFVRAVYASFRGNVDFSWLEVRQLLRRSPELLRINEKVRHKSLGEVDGRSAGRKSR